MREIKFRVWDIYPKKMLNVNEARFVDGRMIGVKGVGWDGQKIIMQFTGLKDKNGKEIYEGDILRLYNHKDITMQVKWIEEEARFKLLPELGAIFINLFSKSFYEVIGNIYENPELLKGGEG